MYRVLHELCFCNWACKTSAKGRSWNISSPSRSCCPLHSSLSFRYVPFKPQSSQQKQLRICLRWHLSLSACMKLHHFGAEDLCALSCQASHMNCFLTKCPTVLIMYLVRKKQPAPSGISPGASHWAKVSHVLPEGLDFEHPILIFFVRPGKSHKIIM